MVGGGRGDGPEDPGNPGVEEITQGLAGLETVISGVPGRGQGVSKHYKRTGFEYFSASVKEKQGTVLLNCWENFQ